MGIKLTTVGRSFAPDVNFPTDEGMVNNRDLPKAEQVTAEVTLASLGEKTEYLGSYTVGNKQSLMTGEVKQYSNLQFDRCVRKHCKSLKGLEAFNITNGRTLLEHEPTPELNDIVQELFFKINGIHADDFLKGSDGGELLEKE